MVGALRFLALIGHYLINFAGIIPRASALELAKAKEVIDRLRYYLKQEKIANADLIRKIDCSKKALFKARKVINRQNDELRRACRRNEVLER